jgi:glutamate dehydrogenase/leucine dehydrogenase
MSLRLPDDPSTASMDAMLEMGWRQVLRAAHHLEWSSNRLHRFLAPERVTEVSVTNPDTGDVVKALRVQHSTDRGPAKGGVRMTSAVTRTEVEALALFMTLKTATAGLPLGGGKGGIVIDAGDLDDDDRGVLAGRVAQVLAPVIGPDADVLGPDVGTGEAEMLAIDQAWRKATGRSGSAATGKPLDAGGLSLRQGATARGLEIVFDSLADRRSLDGSLRFAVHGFGSVGRGIAERLCQKGHVLVGAADSGGAVIDPDGLDLDSLTERKQSGGSVADGDTASTAVLDVECDVLIPAALQGVIDQAVAERIAASIVLEGANGPCTWAGSEVLRARGITVVPDILANSGGVSASWEEMTDPGDRDDDAVVEQRFEDRLRQACERVWETADAEQFDYRTAATVVALLAQDEDS